MALFPKLTLVSHAPAYLSARGLVPLAAGPLLAALLMVFGDLQPGHPEVTRMAAVALWMAIWWLTEAVPLAVTAMLPVALFPLLGIMAGEAVAPNYFNSIIFLFMGGFIIALAMQRWELHKRLALGIIHRVGVSPRRLMLGFMLATAFLSMWISNTASTMMMVPIALAILITLESGGGPENGEGRETALRRFSIGLLLAIAYSASIGGMATLIGSPPNMVFSQIYQIQFESAPEISFSRWFMFALPMAVIMIGAAWWMLTAIYCNMREPMTDGPAVFEEERRKLGPIALPEKLVLIIFIATALLWLTRSDIMLGEWAIRGWGNWFTAPHPVTGELVSLVDDGTVAVVMALLLFILPSGKEDGRLMRWEDLSDFPWGILFLFGGGFALAHGVKESGFSSWLADHMHFFSEWHPVLLVLMICTGMKFLSEFTSNTASAQMILPVLGSMAVSAGIDPLLLMVPATLSASSPFMLPVATPPNAIIFGTRRIPVQEMSRTGFWLNIASVILITLSIFLLGPLVFPGL